MRKKKIDRADKNRQKKIVKLYKKEKACINIHYLYIAVKSSSRKWSLHTVQAIKNRKEEAKKLGVALVAEFEQ